MFKVKITKVKLIIAAIIVLGIILAAKQCSHEKADVYEYGKAVVGDVSKTIAATGSLELYQPITIINGVAGELRNVYVDFNTRISKGQKLAYVYSPLSDRNLLQQTENMKKAKADLDGQVEYLSAKKAMLAEGLIAQREYDLAEKTYQLSYSNYMFTRSIYMQMIEEQNKKNIISPSDGIVIQIFVDQNKLIDLGTPMFLIAPTLKKMKLKINIDENDVGLVSSSQPVEFTVSAYPDKKFFGKIEQVRMNPKTINGMVTYESMVICENPEEILRPGMSVSAIIKVDTKTHVLVVPNQALVVNPSKTSIPAGTKVVWVKRSVSGKKMPVKKVEVITGLQGDSSTEIISGALKEGDQVLTGYYQRQMD